VKGVGSIRRAMLRGGWRFRGGTSSNSYAEAVAARAVVVMMVVASATKRGDVSVAEEEGMMAEERVGEKAAVTANVIARAAARIFIV